jgi:uncharacterized membrane protein
MNALRLTSWDHTSVLRNIRLVALNARLSLAVSLCVIETLLHELVNSVGFVLSCALILIASLSRTRCRLADVVSD